MLYVTTHNGTNSYTAHNALHEDFAPDNGAYVPFRLPQYSTDELLQLKDGPFSQTVADMLNMFFSARVTSSEIDLCVGKNNIALFSMNHKIVIAELWHNAGGCFAHIENLLNQRLTDKPDAEITNWVKHAVRIGYLFGIYGEMLRNGSILPGQTYDISVPNDDFIMPMSAWYSRAMGLPIRMIICSCDEGSNIWDFINHGVTNTASISNALRTGLSRLIFSTAGEYEAVRFSESSKNQAFGIEKDLLPNLNDGLFCAVAGNDRAKNTINSVYRSNAYIMDAVTALSYSALQDYRAKTGESGLTLLLAEQNPLGCSEIICDATGLSKENLREYIKRT